MSSPLQDPEEDFEEPPHLRRLRLLVTVLTSVLIFGMLAMVAIFVIRLGLPSGVVGDTPIQAERFVLPEGEAISALGRGSNTVLITVDGPKGEVLYSFDAMSGKRISATPIARE
ncbi:MAG: DUF6476 family protein [Pseudomonadota bacterium]